MESIVFYQPVGKISHRIAKGLDRKDVFMSEESCLKWLSDHNYQADCFDIIFFKTFSPEVYNILDKEDGQKTENEVHTYDVKCAVVDYCEDPDNDADTALGNFIYLMKKYVDSETCDKVFNNIAEGLGISQDDDTNEDGQKTVVKDPTMCYLPYDYDGDDIPEELVSGQVFESKRSCRQWLENYGYDPSDFYIEEVSVSTVKEETGCHHLNCIDCCGNLIRIK